VAIEQPQYEVAAVDGDLEIRRYPGYIVAETFVTGDFESAGDEGFGRLFRYITGANRGRSEIGMTAPVGQRPGSGQEISMTAPVAQRSEPSGHWVSFVMPAAFTLETLPVPTDPRVRLREVPAQQYAVLRYSGFWSESRYSKEESRLRAIMNERGLEASGFAQLARYNPPFTPPFMRRNEILIPVAGDVAVTRTTPSAW
jgi:hypothetical protein